jgi:hypothetical protein
MLEGRRFIVFTDHKPLTFVLHKQAEPWTALQQRHFSYIAEFTGDIPHVAGCTNGVADALSRPPPSAVPCTAGQGGKTNSSIATTSGGLRTTVEALPVSADTYSTIAAASSPVPASAAGEVIDLAAIAAAQAACTSTQQAARTSSLHVKTFEVEGVSLLCDTSTGAAHPLVPAPHRWLLFDSIHNLANPGVRATKRLIKSQFVWPGMGADMADWCSECQACNRGKVTCHVRAPLQAIAVPDRCFSHLHVDLVGLLPTSQEGYSHLLTVIDRSSRWIEAIPMVSTSAQACADAVIGGWFARFAGPQILSLKVMLGDEIAWN